MFKNIIYVLLLALIISACDVTNPNVTTDDFNNSPNATKLWKRGTERELASTVSSVILGSMLISDNYMNNRTQYSKVFDYPQILSTDLDVTNIQSQIHALRVQAEIGLNEVAPADTATSNEDLSDFHFYRGVALLYSGEYFTGLPTTSDGAPKSFTECINEAITELKEAITLTSDAEKLAYLNALISRGYYHIGDATNAVSFAEEALGYSSNFIRFVEYGTDLGNGVQVAVYSGQDEFEPLPRLDFLDPKFAGNTSDDQKPIALIKAEELHFIIAEAKLASGDLGGAKNSMKNVLDLINNDASRNEIIVDESSEARGVGRDVEYPNHDTILVRASENDEYIAGLVKNRVDPTQSVAVSIPGVSGTSVDYAMIDATVDADDLLEMLYLMRQEVFMAEGRRMVDLGIKWPMAQLEADSNPNAAGSVYLTPQLPSFIPGDKGMDEFTWDKAAGTVTIKYNMNKVIVENKSSAFVVPFM